MGLLCESCCHYRMRREPILFGAQQLSFDSILEAQLKWERKRRERAVKEFQLYESGFEFSYEPHNYPWCSFFSTVKQPRTDCSQSGSRFVLCIKKIEEQNGSCSAYEGRNGDPGPPRGPIETAPESHMQPEPLLPIKLGDRMFLEQINDPLGAWKAKARNDRGLVPGIDLHPQATQSNSLNATRMTFKLVPSRERSDSEVCIKGKGIYGAYGIFGAPGSGKTTLMLKLLGRLLDAKRPGERFGALVLDPKGTILDPSDPDKLDHLLKKVGRHDDLILISPTETLFHPVNLIDCGLQPNELGRLLVQAAQSVGVVSADPYWGNSWGNLFENVLLLFKHVVEDEVITLRRLMELLAVTREEYLAQKAGFLPTATVWGLLEMGRMMLAKPDIAGSVKGRFIRMAIDEVTKFYTQRDVTTIEQFISRAYGAFKMPTYDGLSSDSGALSSRANIYDEIINNGKVVVVSFPAAEPTVGRIVCTLVKSIFQRLVLARRTMSTGQINTTSYATRPVLLFCDEYKDIATELPGEPMGDGYFFSLAREFRCMGLLATQSVALLEGALKERWKSVFSNFSVKIFFRLADAETAEEASKLAGECDWRIANDSFTLGGEGITSTRALEIRQRALIPAEVFLNSLETGQAVAIGTLDLFSRPKAEFFNV